MGQSQAPLGLGAKLSLILTTPSLSVKTNFFRLLAMGQKVGLGLRESLMSIALSEHNATMKHIIQDLISYINQGESLAYAMSKHLYFFTTTEVELIRAAQNMGNLPETLTGIAKELEDFALINKKIKSALTYPITLLVFAIGATAILLVKVVPTIVSLYSNADSLPMITQIMLQASDFMIEWWYILFLGLVGIAIVYNMLYSYFLPFKIAIDGLVLRLPAVGDVVKNFYMYRFSKLLGDFTKAGVDQLTSIDQMSKIFSNFFYKKKAEDIRTDLNAGFAFADTIEGSTLFDPILTQIIVVGEKTGNMGDILQKMAKFYKEQLIQKIAVAMALIEPILMGLIALLIGSIVAAIYLPLIGITENISQMGA